jgi:hypothetical protein
MWNTEIYEVLYLKIEVTLHFLFNTRVTEKIRRERHGEKL